MIISSFDKMYTMYTGDSINEHLEECKKDVFDPWYYEARDNLIHCSHNELRTLDEDSNYEIKGFESFIIKHMVEKVDLQENSKIPYYEGPILKYILNIDNKEYIIVMSTSGIKWYYFTQEFIEVYSRWTNTPIQYSDPIPFYI